MLRVQSQNTGTEVVPDLLVVKILNEHYRYNSFEYVIYSDDKNIIRKGSFRAPAVQLRTIGLDKGVYHIDLLMDGQKWKTNHFEKRDQQFLSTDKKISNTIFFK